TAAKTYHGSCFCGAVGVSVSGEPAAMGYCHCESCRSWSAGPVNAFSLWPVDAGKGTRGGDRVGAYPKTPRRLRQRCAACGSHLPREPAIGGRMAVFGATIPDFRFKAGVQGNYQETRLRMHDGLPKMQDLPKEMGGTGVAITE